MAVAFVVPSDRMYRRGEACFAEPALEGSLAGDRPYGKGPSRSQAAVGGRESLRCVEPRVV